MVLLGRAGRRRSFLSKKQGGIYQKSNYEKKKSIYLKKRVKKGVLGAEKKGEELGPQSAVRKEME